MTDNIRYIESITGELSKQDKTLYCINWINNNGKAFREFYEKTVLLVSYKPTFDSKEEIKKMSIEEFESFEIKPDYRELTIVRID
jgi:hypothetical protein